MELSTAAGLPGLIRCLCADRGGSTKSTNGRKGLVSTEEWIPPPPKDPADEPQSRKLNINDMFESTGRRA